MAMSNADCIERLNGYLDMEENREQWLLQDDEFAEGDPQRYQEDLREVERDIEAIKRAIRALQRTAKKRKVGRDGEKEI